MSNQSSSLMGAVPQISYDIIARVIPGIAIILVWILVYGGPTQTFSQFVGLLSSPASALTFGGFLILALLGYLVSITLFGMSLLIARIWNIIFRRSKHASGIETMSHTENKQDMNNPTTALMYDFIRTKSPEAGARLVKLRAEYDLARTLIMGLAIASIYNIFPLADNSSVERVSIEAVLVIAVIGLWSFGNYIERRYTANLKNHWHILKTPDDIKQGQKKKINV